MPTLTLIKQPYEISFTGNPMPFIWQVAPYGSKEQSSDITVTVRVLVESIFNSGVFDEAYVQKLSPAGDGTVKVDVGSVVSSYLDYYTPRADLTRPVEAIGQRKRYQVTTTLDAPGLFPPGWYDLPPIYVAPVYYYAIKGGLAKEAWHYKEFFTKIVQEDKLPMVFSAARELVDPEALKYLYWIYPSDDNAEQTVTYIIYLSDGTTVTNVNANTIISGKWSVNCVPAGFNQCGLDELIPVNKSAVKYSIQVSTTAGAIINEYFFNLDNRNFYDKYFLLYRNSIGGLETVRLLGEVDLAAAYDRQQARRTLPPDWFNAASIKDEATEETFSYTAETGFMSREQLLKLRDLFLAKEVFMPFPLSIGEGSGVRLLPAVLTSNKTKFYSNKDNLISTSIEWQLAFINTFFTPGALMPQTRTCPAVEQFIVTQLNKSTLQLMWSLEDPYTQIEVQIIIDATIYTYTYKGNTGMVLQQFANPVVDDPVDITIKARTVCNPDSVPVDYGAFTTIILSVHGDSLPVAVDDYFQVPIGFIGVLSGSLLDNDYDPDGDPIEAVPNFGLFGNGSSPAVFQVDIDGNVTITNTPIDMVGKQTFDYQIRNPLSSDYVTGHVFINFGDGPQAIYIKVVKRNVVTTGTYLNTRSTGEIWIDFFSDPSCTIPIDLTAYGLPVSVHFKKDYKDTSGNPVVTTETDTIYYSTGIKMKIYTGEINLYQYGGVVNNYTFYTWTINPGTGYTPVN